MAVGPTVGPATSALSQHEPVPPLVDHLGPALLGAAMVLGLCAVATTLLSAAPAVRPGGDWGTRTRPRVLAPLAMTTGGAVITFVAYIAFEGRCGLDCIDRGGPQLAGRDVWWRVEEAWQWSAQLAIASVGLAAAAIALVCAARGWQRAAGTPLWVARIAYAVWALAALIVPLGLELTTG
jgi:hypothetical protein